MIRLLVAAFVTAFVTTSVFAVGQTLSTPRPGQIVTAPKAPPPKEPNARDAARSTDPNKGTAIIRGRILLAGGRPARRASIQLTSTSAPRATASDDDGRYEFTDLPADSYRLSAGKAGYLVLEYGQQRAFEHGNLILLGDGETLEKIDITLPTSGSISGRIVDENGDPVEGVAVRLMQLQYSANRRQLVNVAAAGGRATDDTGHYRIYGVPPGEYVVAASVTDRVPAGSGPNGAPLERAAANIPGYAPTYYPGTVVVSEAQSVRVGLSQDVSSIDLALATAHTARISGTALDSRGQPMNVLIKRSLRSAAVDERPMRASMRSDGEFTFEDVAPGEYVLQTKGLRRDEAIESDFAYEYVTVAGRDVTGLRLQGTNGSIVSGHLVFEGLAGTVKPPSVQLGAWPTDFDRAPMLIDDDARTRPGGDGRFTLGGLHGPRRLRLLQAPSSWSLKSVRVNGFDVTDEVLSFGAQEDSLTDVEVVLSNNGPSVIGTVRDLQGRLLTDYTVVAFATDPERWYQRSRFLSFARPRHDGTFTVSALSPAEYYVAAVDSLEGADSWGEWQDPDFLRTIANRATRVTLGEGQSVPLALQVIAR